MAKIKTGDVVYVITGSDRGKRGTVRSVDPKSQRVVVEGVMLCTRHSKPSVKNPEGGRVTKEQSIHISNVALANPETLEKISEGVSLTTRVGYRIEQDGTKIRYAKLTGKPV